MRYNICIYILVDGVWLDWQAWEICSVTCGGGERTRVRACEGPFYDGAECVGPVDDTEECGSDPCPSKLFLFSYTRYKDIIYSR